jgi:hypothetical protein
MNLTDAVAQQITAELDAMAQEEKNRYAAVQEEEADGRRIVDGGSIIVGDSDDDDRLQYEYTDWRTEEVIYREKDDIEPWPSGWCHIDAIHNDCDVTAEPVAGLPESLVEAINSWVCENEEDARAWIQGGQGGSIT